MKIIAPPDFPRPVAGLRANSPDPVERPKGDGYDSGDFCPYNPWSIKPMSMGERVATTAGLATLGSLSGLFAGFLTMSSRSQLSALPYFGLAGGIAGCALAGVVIIGES